MTNILILGAHGQIARVATDLFLKHTDARLTLYLRNARRLRFSGHADRVRVVEGDVLDTKALEIGHGGPGCRLCESRWPSWNSRPGVS
jgi:saccharopine dehydrogenase-like NADP-dependent oxidoreductase